MSIRPIYVELLDDNHEVLYANVYHSITWAKQCIKELEIKYRYIRVTYPNRFNNKIHASIFYKL